MSTCKNNMKLKIFFTLFLSLILFRYTQAVELVSSISSYFNTYQTQDLYSGEKTSYLRAYQSFRFDLNRIGTEDLSFHTYFRSTTEFIHKNSTDPSTRIYNAYLDWKNIKKIMDLRLGRQFLYVGAGKGTMDGLRFDFRPARRLQLTGYAGFQLPQERWTSIDSWGKSHIFGGEVSTTYLRNTRLALSYVRKTRDKSEERHLIGFNVSHLYRKFDFYSQLYYDLVYKKVQNLTLRGAGSRLWGRLYSSLEYQFRRPSIYSNSIFSVFQQETYSLFRFSVAYQLRKSLRLFAEYALTLYESDNASRARFGFEYGFISLGIRIRRGYAGEDNGVYGGISYSLRRNLVFSASADYGEYKLDEEQEGGFETLVLTSRIEWEPLRN
ncbi:MAG: hypothetical protein OEV55_10140, partial [candidate division Zixibacteria bacterium]|nr:hypothetical protein [candidate division Zixibacteria bacterium]